ncbi:uncharacterized protein LOC128279192 [Anopheles cruzii]|uniref:uncharacterized protein LOC128279192 n=1 Tax=Anopheles cruzii TaxID=68878 RepID=UPI0022EC2D4C|nr:uncharacterized protein LOC128279192 [Anopheles cruzii]
MAQFSATVLTLLTLIGGVLSGNVPRTAVDQRVAAVRDILTHLENARRLLVLVCWPPTIRYQLWREINAGRIPMELQFATVDSNNLPWHDPDRHLVVVVADLACAGTDRLLQQSGHLLYYRLRWVILHSEGAAVRSAKGWKNCSEYSTLDDLPLLVSNEVYYFCTDPSTGQHLVRQQYRLSRTGPITVETVGPWEPTKGVVVAGPRAVTYVRRRNFNQFQLRASLVLQFNDTVNHLNDYSNKHRDTLSRISYHLTNSVGLHLNASVRFTIVTSWGYRNATTGLYTGMIGELQTDLADLGASSLFFTPDRIPVIDYLSMPIKARVGLIFRAPKLSYTDNVFVLPFERYVWYSTLSFIVLSALLMALVLRCEQRYTGRPEPLAAQDSFGLSDTVLNSFGTTCQQGSFIEPKRAASRCLLLICLVLLMFLYASYSANIVAMIQSPSTKIQTTKDLLESRMKVGSDDTTYNRYYFRHSTEPLLKALYDQKLKNKDGSENFIPLRRGIELVQQGLYAFHVELGIAYLLINDLYQEGEKCDLKKVDSYKLIDPYYAVQKNTSFRESVRIALFRLREFGIQEREHSLLYTKKPRCSGATSFVPISIVDIWPALAIFGWGCLLAVMTLVAELWVRSQMYHTLKAFLCLKKANR